MSILRELKSGRDPVAVVSRLFLVGSRRHYVDLIYDVERGVAKNVWGRYVIRRSSSEIHVYVAEGKAFVVELASYRRLSVKKQDKPRVHNARFFNFVYLNVKDGEKIYWVRLVNGGEWLFRCRDGHCVEQQHYASATHALAVVWRDVEQQQPAGQLATQVPPMLSQSYGETQSAPSGQTGVGVAPGIQQQPSGQLATQVPPDEIQSK
ncbi:hypothetical protein [Pyrobaculum sp.]|uniref:hypothetical protein n=1 Tax=Pyrobaculum sp. TaxID=2004705 RepID=UPI003D11CE81